MLDIYIKGLLIGFSLCMVIGPQNAFILKQGLKKQHVLWVCTLCALSDSVLIWFGVAGFANVIQASPILIQWAKFIGAGFLFIYAILHVKHAMKGGQVLLASSTHQAESLTKIIFICLAFTWLNPHVYLDTVVLIGSLSIQYGASALSFGLGAATASWILFFSLGFGAKLLLPYFQSTKAWQILDGIIAVVMFSVALSLVVTA